jgi:hypothetical protein
MTKQERRTWTWPGQRVKKACSIGFCEDELKEIEAAFKSCKKPFKRQSQFIKYLALTCLDREQEIGQLQNALTKVAQAHAQAAAVGQSSQAKETAWTGAYHGIRREGNVIFPVWG